MKALSIQQPWAYAITNGTKRVENRTWASSYRGLLLIHAGKAFQKGMEHAIHADSPEVDLIGMMRAPRGAIVGVCRMLDCVSIEELWPASLRHDERLCAESADLGRRPVLLHTPRRACVRGPDSLPRFRDGHHDREWMDAMQTAMAAALEAMDMSDYYGELPGRCYVVRIGETEAVGFVLASALAKARDRAGKDQTRPVYAVCEDTAFFVPYPIERIGRNEWLEVPDGI